MKESILCCISCILPCGALDVVRIVHATGRVDEIAGNTVIFAADIMGAHPQHVLRKLPSHVSSSDEHSTRAVTLPPSAELKRGKIYFLMPVEKAAAVAAAPGRRRRKKRIVVTSGGCLPEVTAENVAAPAVGRRRRVSVWRPALESISEQCCGAMDL